METIANLKQIALEVLTENSNLDIQNENNRLDLAQKIEERYKNLARIIAKDFLEKEINKRSTLSTFQQIIKH